MRRFLALALACAGLSGCGAFTGTHSLLAPLLEDLFRVTPSVDPSAPVPGGSGVITTTAVTTTSLTLNWTKATDDITAQADLQYRVYQSSTGNIATVVDAATNGTIVQDWAADIATCNVTGLSAATTLYFVVVVRDLDGKERAYSMVSQAMLSDADPVPGASGTITTAAVTMTSLTLNWTKATDDVTAPAALEYRVYQSTSNDISSVATAASGTGMIQDWTADINTLNVSGLTLNTTYYFNVFVRDDAGNISAYSMMSQATLNDTTVPTPGGTGTITTAAVTSTSLTLNWTVATDDVTAQAALEYRVYRSTSNDIGSVATAASTTGMIQDWTANPATLTVTGLALNTTYYFNVFVRDTAGNISAYTMMSQMTTGSLLLQTIDSPGVGWFTSLAMSGSSVYVAYFDSAGQNLKFARSVDGGLTWPTILTVDSVGDVGRYAAIAVSGANVYISYWDNTNGNLKVARSVDGGSNWLGGNITTIDSAGIVGQATSIAANGTAIYVSYYDQTNGKLKFARSTDSGATWPAGNIRTIDATSNIVGWKSSVGFSGSDVYVAYSDTTDGDLRFARSTDGGATWPAGNIRIVDSTGDVGMDASMAVSGTDVCIAYSDTTNGDLKFARSTDSGDTWAPGNIQIVDSTGSVGGYVSLARDGASIYVSYENTTNSDLKFARSVDNGITWAPGSIRTVDMAGSVGRYTGIAVSGSTVGISYFDDTNSSLKFARSTDSGGTW